MSLTEEIDYTDRVSQVKEGHFGHLELAKPVIITSQAHRYIIKILNSVCYRCANVRLDLTDVDVMTGLRARTGKNRFIYATELEANNTNRCGHCEALLDPFRFVEYGSTPLFSGRGNKYRVFGFLCAFKSDFFIYGSIV